MFGQQSFAGIGQAYNKPILVTKDILPFWSNKKETYTATRENLSFTYNSLDELNRNIHKDVKNKILNK